MGVAVVGAEEGSRVGEEVGDGVGLHVGARVMLRTAQHTSVCDVLLLASNAELTTAKLPAPLTTRCVLSIDVAGPAAPSIATTQICGN